MTRQVSNGGGMSLLAFLQACCVAAFAVLLIAAGWQDLRTMRIANGLSVGIAASFIVWAAAGMGLGHLVLAQIGWAFACAAAVFGLGALAFAVGAVGGGDVKLLAAASLFAGPAHQIDFLTVTALVGGFLGLAILAGAQSVLPIAPKAPCVGACRTVLRSLPAAYGWPLRS